MRRALAWSLASVVLTLGVVLAAVAQDDTPDPSVPEENPTEPATEPAAEPSPEERARRSKMVARVGEVTITLGDVEDAIAQQSPFMRVRYRDRAQLEAFVQSMIRFELLARAAERAEIGDRPEVVRVVKQNAVQQLIRREFDERITPESIEMPEIEEYFSGHPEEFARPEMRRAAHVQLASREEAERLMEQAREADNRAFRELARDSSIDTETRLRGGDLRFFDAEGRARNSRDPQVHEALAAAAFGLSEVGDVVGPVEVGEHFSIVKLTGVRPAESRSYLQAEPTIRLRLWRQRRQQEMEDFVARLRREGNVEVHHDLIRNIRLDAPAREDEHAEEDRPVRGVRPPRAPGAQRGRTPPASRAEAAEAARE